MKYFIGYLIQGEAADWHAQKAKEISAKFNTWKIYEKIPPHITLYRPFDLENIQPVLDVLQTWSNHQSSGSSFLMSDFDRFDDRVVFVKIETNQAIQKMVVNLKRELKLIPNIPAEDYPNWHPHATLAERVTTEEIEKIWNHVSTLDKPKFSLPFDNMTLFSNAGDRVWKIEKVFDFK